MGAGAPLEEGAANPKESQDSSSHGVFVMRLARGLL